MTSSVLDKDNIFDFLAANAHVNVAFWGRRVCLDRILELALGSGERPGPTEEEHSDRNSQTNLQLFTVGNSFPECTDGAQCLVCGGFIWWFCFQLW